MEPLQIYFLGERQAGLCAAALGLASLAFAFFLFRSVSPFRAMLIPLGVVGLLQLGVGVGLYLKTPAQVATLEQGLSQAASRVETHAKETARMQRVQANFVTLKLAWIALIAVGLGLVLLGRGKPATVGIGLGILLQAAVMLAFDLFAEARGADYLRWLSAGGVTAQGSR
jgi:hypothetical protein